MVADWHDPPPPLEEIKKAKKTQAKTPLLSDMEIMEKALVKLSERLSTVTFEPTKKQRQKICKIAFEIQLAAIHVGYGDIEKAYKILSQNTVMRTISN